MASTARCDHVLLAVAITLAPAAEAAAQEDPAPPVGFRLVHEEPLGGADSAISPDGKWLAFSSRRSGHLDLWMVGVETGELRQLTDSPSRDYEPRWHPEGTQIVFTSDRERNQDIYTLDLQTLAVAQQTSTRGVADYPSFSQDGSEIVFTGGPFGRHPMREVFVKNLASGEVRQVTDGHRLVGSTSFSPDGKRIVYHAYYQSYGSERSDIWIVDAAGGEGRNITRAPDIWDYKPVWSYCGEWITFSSKRGTENFNVFVMRPDGSDLRAITDQHGPDFRWPNFTRDGRLAWHAIVPQSGRVLCLEIATGKLREVARSSSYIGGLWPSPDGRHLLYADGFRIQVLDAGDPAARPRSLARGREPRWSADGTVTFLGIRDETVYRVSLQGGTAERAPAAARGERQPVAAVAASGGRRAAIVDGELVLTAADGTERTVAEGGAAKSSPVWSADGARLFFCQGERGAVRYYVTGEPVVGR